MAAALEVPRQVDDGVIVDAAPHHGVDLERRQPGALRRLDAGEHARHREVDVVHRAEDGVVERVEAHRDALQAGVGEMLRLLGEQRAVRRRRDLDVRDLGEHPHQLRQSLADQRLAAGESQLAHATRREDARDPRDLLEPAGCSRAAGTRSRGRRPRAACSTGSGSCSGPSPRCAGRAAAARTCRAAPRLRAGRWCQASWSAKAPAHLSQ